MELNFATNTNLIWVQCIEHEPTVFGSGNIIVLHPCAHQSFHDINEAIGVTSLAADWA